MRVSHLVLGGVKSGKSRFALHVGARAGTRRAFVATAVPSDPDMVARIARHRAERAAAWGTVEESVDVASACRRLAASADVAVIDCLTLWVAARMERGDDDSAILQAADDLATVMAERLLSVVVVSNDVGQGVHPPTALGRRFVDVLGLVNQRIAAAADVVTLMVAGIPVPIQDRTDHGPRVDAP